jgi:hypothetical protein
MSDYLQTIAARGAGSHATQTDVLPARGHAFAEPYLPTLLVVPPAMAAQGGGDPFAPPAASTPPPHGPASPIARPGHTLGVQPFQPDSAPTAPRPGDRLDVRSATARRQGVPPAVPAIAARATGVGSRAAPVPPDEMQAADTPAAVRPIVVATVPAAPTAAARDTRALAAEERQGADAVSALRLPSVGAAPAPRPEVRISIGRIDVHVELPAPAAPEFAPAEHEPFAALLLPRSGHRLPL